MRYTDSGTELVATLRGMCREARWNELTGKLSTQVGKCRRPRTLFHQWAIVGVMTTEEVAALPWKKSNRHRACMLKYKCAKCGAIGNDFTRRDRQAPCGGNMSATERRQRAFAAMPLYGSPYREGQRVALLRRARSA